MHRVLLLLQMQRFLDLLHPGLWLSLYLLMPSVPGGLLALGTCRRSRRVAPGRAPARVARSRHCRRAVPAART